ncbi:hypothetical protein FKW77_005402, partial [Venturia effusa]
MQLIHLTLATLLNFSAVVSAHEFKCKDPPGICDYGIPASSVPKKITAKRGFVRVDPSELAVLCLLITPARSNSLSTALPSSLVEKSWR